MLPNFVSRAMFEGSIGKAVMWERIALSAGIFVLAIIPTFLILKGAAMIFSNGAETNSK
jgi:hypothetical protein